MQRIWAAQAKQALAAVLDAAQREPVVIRRRKRDVAVLLSLPEYERLTALNVDDISICATGSASGPRHAA